MKDAHMKWTVYFILFLPIFLAVLGCEEKEINSKICNTPATVRDLTGLDGCTFVLELSTGEYLQPLLTESNSGFKFEAGKKVTIDYKIVYGGWVSVCMAGDFAIINCISEVP